MKGVMAELPQALIDERKRTGAHQWDEMWEGVLHMPPMPNREHQDFQWPLVTWLKLHWARPFGSRVHQQINLASVGGWPNDYRIPDILLLTPDRFQIDKNEYFEGAPAVVVEIRSPKDETYDKFPFFLELGVPEVWVIDRDTKVPEVYLLSSGEYQRLTPARGGWIKSEATNVWIRGAEVNKLAIQINDDNLTYAELPDEM